MTAQMAEIITPWLTPEEAAAYLKHSVHTLANWRRDGTGPRYSRAGAKGSVVYHVADLDDWLRSHSHSPTHAEDAQCDTGVASMGEQG